MSLQLVRILLTVVSTLTVLCQAVPTPLLSRDVSQQNLDRFAFWIEYAAASYCEANYIAQEGSTLACSADNCPQVEKSDNTILHTFSNTTITDTAGFVALDNTHKAIVVSFRGSYSVRNWITDATFPHTLPGLCDGCTAELGFWTAWDVVKEEIMATLSSARAQNPDYELVVAGHSLGAAIATLAATDLRNNGYAATLYAYASPRVANEPLAAHITNQGNNYRFTHTKDPVPHLPPLAMGYVHISPEYYITSPDNVTVTTSDIQVLEGYVNFDGNTGQASNPVTDFSNHKFYFIEADGCKGPGLPLKKL